ncbi:cytochrome P450 3A6-like [Haliotis rufescens]|uniref:cytochrome P450 3A6-like n=1 Tax=Haliotis rufescens TaxID=6454 RepID=UPI00201E9D33|nr:cytochrome P450 3A6-like [Haliotis rufescens]XP_048245524.1 cytochrome P450 3A6-like [Haliotis rufescens]
MKEWTMEWLSGVYSRMNQGVTWREVGVYLTVGGSTWLLYKTLVKPFLSPLRQIPGPPYKPVVGNMFDALRAEAMSNTIEWMTTYKSRIIRYYFLYGEGRVLVADPDLVKYISVTNSKNYGRVGSSINFRSLARRFVLFMDGDEHHALRKVMNPAFSLSTVESFIPTFVKRAEDIVAMWDAAVTQQGHVTQVDAQMTMMRLTLDLICECGFDYQLHAVENPTAAGVQSFRRILQGSRLRLMQMIPFFRSLPTQENRQLWQDNKTFVSAITDMISKKRTQLENTQLGQGVEHKGDLLSILFQARDEDGKSLQDNVIFDQIAGFLFAGFETTSTLLTWTLLLLGEHPAVQDKLRSEIRSLLPSSSGQLTSQTLDQMTFLNCVVKESLRMYPPVSNVFRRAINDDNVGGYFIPAGTIVGISIGGLHRLPENWEDPNTFRPERFLQEINPYKFQPFTAGPYMCIGHRFAVTEAKAILVTLLNNFKFDMVPGYKYRRVRYLTIQPHPPLVLNVSRV